MMKKTINALLMSAVFGLSSSAWAAEPSTAQLQEKLSSNLGVSISSLEAAPVAGFYQAFTDRGIIYVSTDGSKLLHGTLYDMDNQMLNLTEQAMQSLRQAQVQKLRSSGIEFKAKNEKYVVDVFTDISCGYCRKLHDDIAAYNDLGITIRYFAFPRNGEKHPTWQQMEQIWCATDQRAAMTESKIAGKAPTGTHLCPTAKAVEHHYQLGQRLGVNGTPALVTEKGQLIPGYLPPQKLLERLQQG